MARLAVLALVLLGLCISGCGASSGGNSSAAADQASAQTTTASKKATAKPTPAFMLATIQESGPPPHSLVASFQTALTHLKPVCRENGKRTAAEIDATNTLLEKAGVAWASELRVARGLEHAGSVLPGNARPTSCAALLAAYATFAEQPGATP